MKRARMLLCAVPLLLAAGPPPDPCATATGTQVPVPMDLSGQPQARQSLLSQMSAAAMAPNNGLGCASSAYSNAPGSLRDSRGDVLHGLTPPDVTRPLPTPAGSGAPAGTPAGAPLGAPRGTRP